MFLFLLLVELSDPGKPHTTEGKEILVQAFRPKWVHVGLTLYGWTDIKGDGNFHFLLKNILCPLSLHTNSSKALSH